MRSLLLRHIAPGIPWEQTIYVALGIAWIAMTIGGNETVSSQPRWIFWIMVATTPLQIVRLARGITQRLDRRTESLEK